MPIIFVLLAGQLLISLVMGLPAAKKMSVQWLDGWFIELFHCSLCLGVWIYFSLCCLFHVEITSLAAGVGYLPVVSEAITSAAFSWFMHIFFIGLQAKYSEISL
jgi:hypothetical protein